jgi:hypothetical protein
MYMHIKYLPAFPDRSLKHFTYVHHITAGGCTHMFKYPNRNVEQNYIRANGKIKKRVLLMRKDNCKSKLHSRRIKKKHFSP